VLVSLASSVSLAFSIRSFCFSIARLASSSRFCLTALAAAAMSPWARASAISNVAASCLAMSSLID